MFSRILASAAVALFFGAAAVQLAACDTSAQDIGSNCAPDTPSECCPCPVPEACPDGSPPLPSHCLVDAGSDASQSAACSGSCVPRAPEMWEGPTLAMIGAGIEIAACPTVAPNIAFEGRAAPEPWSLVCPTCSCGPPTSATCELPTTWTLSTDACSGGGVNTNFDPPSGWDGSCSSDKSIPSGQLCGNVPCVRSIVVSSPLIHEGPCIPGGSDEPPEPPRVVAENAFSTAIRACTAVDSWPTCADGMQVCVPYENKFSTCIFSSGEQPCPEGWDNKYVFHEQVEDHRMCEPCTCGAPAGGTCQARFRLFMDGSCQNELLAAQLFSGEPAPCHVLSAGVALGAKSAEILGYQPGSCMPSTSKPVGDVAISEPVTFCCLVATI